MKKTRYWVMIPCLAVGLGGSMWLAASFLINGNQTGGGREGKSQTARLAAASARPPTSEEPDGAAPAHPQEHQPTEKTPLSEQVEAFGIKEGKKVDAGFVFFDGQYIDTPYVVSRKGLSVFINDTMVYDHPWPLKEAPSGEIDPPMPPEITRDTSVYDQVFTQYAGKKIAYVQKHNTREEERRIMEQFYRKLPFVKEARLDPEYPDILHVTTSKGETDPIGLTTPRRRVRTDRASVLSRVERIRQNFEGRLQKGDCYLLFSSGGQISFGAGKVITRLPRIVEILRSEKTVETKCEEIQQEGLPIVRGGGFARLVTNFSASPQLDERLRALRQNHPGQVN